MEYGYTPSDPSMALCPMHNVTTSKVHPEMETETDFDLLDGVMDPAGLVEAEDLAEVEDAARGGDGVVVGDVEIEGPNKELSHAHDHHAVVEARKDIEIQEDEEDEDDEPASPTLESFGISSFGIGLIRGTFFYMLILQSLLLFLEHLKWTALNHSSSNSSESRIL
jgi:hypothetical protein